MNAGPQKEVPWVVWAAFLAAALFVAYIPLWRNGFVTWDDPEAIIDNPFIRGFSLENLKEMFTTFLTGNWIPLTWMSLALDHQLHGLDPRVFHGTNLFIHWLNSLLVFGLCGQFLEKAGARPEVRTPAAFLTAVLFALHPIHVESVAWATERKDVLYAFFFLSALWVYLKGVTDASTYRRTLWIVHILFILSLLSKPMAVTLPFVLFLFDLWPLGRWEKGKGTLFVEKLPMLAMGAAAGMVTISSHEAAHAYFSPQSVTLTFRVMNSFRNFFFYPIKMIWPSPLVPFYPLPRTGSTVYFLENDAAVILTIALLGAAFLLRRRMPAFGAALLFYILVLSPVIGFIQAGSQASADRYTYLSSLAFFLPFGWGSMALLQRKPLFQWILTSGFALLLGCLTWNQLAVWQGPIPFWECVVRYFPTESQLAHSNLGLAYCQAEQPLKALQQFDMALRIPPVEGSTHEGRGIALMNLGRTDEAIFEYQEALRLDPRQLSPYTELWFAYHRKKMAPEALMAAKQAVERAPNFAEAWEDLGISYGEAGQLALAQQALEKACSLEPANAQYWLNLAFTYQQEKDGPRAVSGYDRVLALDPRNTSVWYTQGQLYAQAGNYPAAVHDLQMAVQLDPKSELAQKALLKARAQAGLH